jgi:hydrogenase expression/formation protein HypD
MPALPLKKLTVKRKNYLRNNFMESEKDLILKIKKQAQKIKRKVILMELCGSHSKAVAEYGIKKILPKNVKLISGPGCPVCVINQEEADIITGLALKGITVACYGDSAGIPGNIMSLEKAREKGADVQIVYDVKQAVEISKKKKEFVFWGVGFETTAPMTAWGIKNGLCIFSSHKFFPPAMEALLQNKKTKIDGFINPGHVSAIIGTKKYEKFSIPQVVAGFSQNDVLLAINMLLEQIIKNEKKVENEYRRVVRKEGNRKALEIINDVFEPEDAVWRGLGKIKKSGMKIRKKYQKQDAKFVYKNLIQEIKKSIQSKKTSCRCGEVLQGIIESNQCPLFKKVCTPSNPQGACMVSVEGSCNVAFHHK